jgi:hypothetical protein
VVDASKAILDYLLAQPGLTNVVEGRIYAEVDTPPPGYTPADGQAICFKTRGGIQDYEGAILMPSVQFKCYGASEFEANEAYRALCDALNDKASYAIKYARLEALGVTLREPDTDWIYVLAFFSILVTNS